jgi:hypothetical protein
VTKVIVLLDKLSRPFVHRAANVLICRGICGNLLAAALATSMQCIDSSASSRFIRWGYIFSRAEGSIVVRRSAISLERMSQHQF